MYLIGGGFLALLAPALIMRLPHTTPKTTLRYPELLASMFALVRTHADMQRVILLNMDAPQHTRMRSIISRGFTPRAVSNLHDALATRAINIVKTALESGEGDFVRDVACELPLQAIAADVEAGRYRAKPSRVFRFEDIREAHRVMESNDANGKMVVIL